MGKITILDHANVPMGPFTREQVLEKLQRGDVTLSSLAFVEGLTQWTPLRDVMARFEIAAPVPPAPSVPPATLPPATSSAAVYSYAATMQPPAHFVYAGFWLRFVALLVDGLVLSPLIIGYVVLEFVLAGQAQDREVTVQETMVRLVLALAVLVYLVVMIVVTWLYFALLESGEKQATLGKRLVGVRVTGLDGNRISFGRATGRYFSKMISHIILYIGFIMAAFTERKQALHDVIAGTLVVKS